MGLYIAKGKLDALGDLVYVVNVSTFRHIDIYINAGRVKIWEKLHRLFQANHNKPALEH